MLCIVGMPLIFWTPNFFWSASIIVTYLAKAPLSKTCAIKALFFTAIELKWSISLDCIGTASCQYILEFSPFGGQNKPINN